MCAMRVPSREAFKKAIEATAEANMIHLEAAAKERFALLLYSEKEEAHANDYITSSYWLYREWGAHAKALKLSQQYEFLKVRSFSCSSPLSYHRNCLILCNCSLFFLPLKQHSSQKKAQSLTLSGSTHSTGRSFYAFNSTFQSSKLIFVKK